MHPPPYRRLSPSSLRKGYTSLCRATFPFPFDMSHCRCPFRTVQPVSPAIPSFPVAICPRRAATCVGVVGYWSPYQGRRGGTPPVRMCPREVLGFARRGVTVIFRPATLRDYCRWISRGGRGLALLRTVSPRLWCGGTGGTSGRKDEMGVFCHWGMDMLVTSREEGGTCRVVAGGIDVRVLADDELSKTMRFWPETQAFSASRDQRCART